MAVLAVFNDVISMLFLCLQEAMVISFHRSVSPVKALLFFSASGLGFKYYIYCKVVFNREIRLYCSK